MTTAAVARLLLNPRFELIPLGSALRQAPFLPEGATVSVTASPGKTLEDTIDLAVEFTQLGFKSIPHLSARMTRDRDHVESMLARIAAEGIDEVFVVGGDAEQRGEFYDAGALLRAMADVGHDLEVGIAAYPEGHHVFDRETARSALHDKQPFADRLVTQMCFDAAAIGEWLVGIRSDGITLPAFIGIPGVADRRKLMSIALRIGVGSSVRFLSKNIGLARVLAKPGGYTPDELLDEMDDGVLDDPDAAVTGVHIYTFNQVEQTERWRQGYLEALRSST